MNKCKRCHRELKTKKAILLGYGSVCAKILKIKIPRIKKTIKSNGQNILKWS